MSSLAPSGASRRWGPAAHAPFVVAALAGVALRVVVMVAYRPALLFPDSFGYLRRADQVELDNLRPVGYSLFLKPILSATGSTAAIPVTQHLLGLLVAVLCYVFLLRRGLPPWAATLAVLPVLLDPLQLVLEHYVLSDLLFELLLVGACLVLLWRHRPGYVAVALAGLLAASSALVRGAGTLVLVVFVVALLSLRTPWRKVLVFLVGVAVPIVPYLLAFHEKYDTYAVSTAGPRFLYSRLAPKIHCSGLELPSYEKKLCPAAPIARRPNTNYYMWGGHRAAQWHLHPPQGMTALEAVKDFDKRVLRAEPLTYARAVLLDVGGGFAPTRTYQVAGYPASYWLFADHYWSLDQWRDNPALGFQHALRNTSVDTGAARWLTSYRQRLWTPGPLLAALVVVAAVACAGFGRARRSADRVAIGLLVGSCLVTLLTGAALSGFSWRYQLPQLPLLPVAGALAVAAVLRGRRPGAPPRQPGLRPLDRTAELLAAGAPGNLGAALRRAAQRGTLQLVLAVACACAVGVVCAVPVGASGWTTGPTAAVVGVGAGLVAAVVLIVHLARSRAEDRTAPSTSAAGVEPQDEALSLPWACRGPGESL